MIKCVHCEKEIIQEDGCYCQECINSMNRYEILISYKDGTTLHYNMHGFNEEHAKKRLLGLIDKSLRPYVKGIKLTA